VSRLDLAEPQNGNAEFTKWVVSAGLLTEPLVLIDVGVQVARAFGGVPSVIVSSSMASILSRRWWSI
jgi:hypothetical protein